MVCGMPDLIAATYAELAELVAANCALEEQVQKVYLITI